MFKDDREHRRQFEALRAKVIATREEKCRLIDPGLAVEEPNIDIFAAVELNEQHRHDEEMVLAAVGGPRAFMAELTALCSGGFRPFDQDAVENEHKLPMWDELPPATNDQLEAAIRGEVSIADFFNTTSRPKS